MVDAAASEETPRPRRRRRRRSSPPPSPVAGPEAILKLWDWAIQEDNLLVQRTGALVQMEALLIGAASVVYAIKAHAGAVGLIVLASIGIVVGITWLASYSAYRITKQRMYRALHVAWASERADATALLRTVWLDRHRTVYQRAWGRVTGPSGWYGVVLPLLITAAWAALIGQMAPHAGAPATPPAPTTSSTE